MRIAAVLGAGALLVAIAVTVVLSDSSARLSGTNRLPFTGYAIEVPPGERLCQAPELVPADTGSVGFKLPDGAGALGVELTGRGVSSRGRAAGPFTGPDVRIPVQEVEETSRAATVCLENEGSSPVRVGGIQTGPVESAAELGDSKTDARVRIEYLRPGEETWWSLAPAIAHRFGIGKGDFIGGWTIVLMAVLLLGSWAAAGLALLRSERA